MMLFLTLSVCFAIAFWFAFAGRGKNDGVGSFLSRRKISGLDGSDYLVRRYLVPRNRFLNIYHHKFLGSDDDRALHDHPWYSLSLVLSGELIEHKADGSARQIRRGKFTFRKPQFQHRIELPAGGSASTLFITGPVLRTWGFICPNGWTSWRDYSSKGGCD